VLGHLWLIIGAPVAQLHDDGEQVLSMLTRDAQHRAATSVVPGDVLLELHRTFAPQVTRRLPHVPQYPQAIHLLGITFQLRFTLGCVAAPAKADRQLSLPVVQLDPEEPRKR